MLDARIVGKVIQRNRERNGLSQEVVSGLADIGRTHLSAIERGVRKPTLETFFKIAEAMNIEPHQLLKQIGDAKQAH
jgi:transcriptional regulator with XRE-family HTH domain